MCIRDSSIDALLEAADLKDGTHRTRKVVAVGCLAERYGQDLAEQLPEADAVLDVYKRQPVDVPPPAEYVARGAARQAAWVLSGAASPPHWAEAGVTTYEP